jgi:glycosyltransferase involved in cell wall biosynthesis
VRILLISNYAWTVFNFRRGLIQHLARQGHEIHVQTEFDGYESRLGLPVDHVLPLQIDRKGMNPLRDLATLFSIVRAMRRLRPDVCLLFTIKPVIYGGMAATLLSRRYISNITGLGTAFLSSSWLRRTAETLLRISQRKANRVFFQNDEDLSEFVQRQVVSPRIASSLPGSGVDTARFSLMPPRGNDAPVFLMVSRLLRDKGVQEFVQAARLVRKRLPATRFQLLGPFNVVNRTAIAQEEVRSWVDEGVIEYLGETDDVKPFLEAADCIVLPSYREGMPRSLLEAAATGRPVIASDVPGCRQAVEHGKTGFLCRPMDAADLAARLEEMASLPPEERLRMGERGRHKVESEFDERVVLERYAAVIREIASAASLHAEARPS